MVEGWGLRVGVEGCLRRVKERRAQLLRKRPLGIESVGIGLRIKDEGFRVSTLAGPTSPSVHPP